LYAISVYFGLALGSAKGYVNNKNGKTMSGPS
jgi:hypothetical protein